MISYDLLKTKHLFLALTHTQIKDMQKYVPLLDNMINRAKKPPKGEQASLKTLSRMRDLLTNDPKNPDRTLMLTLPVCVSLCVSVYVS